MSERLLFAPDVTSLHQLGAAAADDLFAPQRLATGARAVMLACSRDESEWRVPLPGTPDATGRMPEAPRGAGTGWLRVRVFTGRPADVLRYSVTAPASTSRAAREWNLLCHLAAAGVGTPAVVALVEQGQRGHVARSCLVTRELAGFVPARDWLAARGGTERELGVTSLRHALAQLLRSRVWLPGLSLDGVCLEERQGCGASRLAGRGLAVQPLPGVAIASVAGGRIAARIGARRQRELMRRLDLTANGAT